MRQAALILLRALLLALPLLAQPQPQYDLIVYGATAGGVTTAISAARHGLKTALIEPRNHVGGMVSGGLSGTDVGKRDVIGGMALEYYFRAGRHYNLNRHLQEIAWMPEPGVAETLYRDWLRESNVTLIEKHRLRETNAVTKQSNRITAITMENGTQFTARYFADATYEGDLMAQAKVTYTYGRESTKEYGESLAGVLAHTENHQFAVDIPGRRPDGSLLPEIAPGSRGEPGSADKRIQAYNFRVIATTVPENRLPWPKPANYNPARYDLLALHLNALTPYLGRPATFNEVSLIRILPNGKADLNNRNGFSTDYIGKNYGYPEGTYAERERIWQDHVDYQQGFYYFLANDPRVPKPLQEEVRTWGLAKDEFPDTNHWPNQLYVREARRMVSSFVATQKDLQTERTKPDAIGMGSYNSDSHNVQRVLNEKGFVENEGNMEVPVKPYQIPYRVLVPKPNEATNLLVPVCFSASHVSYSSMRMEPQYMILGHAAGLAAAQAAKTNANLQDIDIQALQKQLLEEGAIFEDTPEALNKSLTQIRKRYAPPARKGPSPWSRPTPKP
jgi:hypothetical protein